MRDELFLGVDGGGTGCRARLCDVGGRIIGEAQGGPANIRFGVEEALGNVEAVARDCLTWAGLAPADLARTVACLGLAGANEPGAAAAARAHPLPFAKTIVTVDAHIACLGAHGGEDGGIVIVGTGSIGWVDAGGEAIGIGGWGFPVSDEGSGAWIGCEAVRAALRAHDGLTASTPLTDAVLARFQGSPHRIVTWMTDAKPRDFGTLAPLVVEHAGRGDPAADAIMADAAARIGALARRLVALGAPRIALMGGLAGPLAPWLPEEIRPLLVTPRGDALDGALLLAREAAGGQAGP